jgi:MtN3 and saliva related transmembrane protein
MDIVQIVGIAASVFSALSLLPQLVKILKDKEANSISWLMLAALFGSITLWSVYGWLKEDWIIIISNGVSFIINIFISIFTMRYKKAA